MKRTQLYLDEELSDKLIEISRKEKRTISQLVREALKTVYLKEKRPDILETLQRCKGIWKDRRGLDTDNFIRELRRDTKRKRSGISDE